MQKAISFLLLFVFSLQTAVPMRLFDGGFTDPIALLSIDISFGETEESCEMETKVKEMDAGTTGWSACGIDFNPPAIDMELAALIGFIITDYHRAAIDEPPES